jgi:hypothetical protein
LLPPPNEAHRGTTRHGLPRHAHHPGAAAPTSKLHQEPSPASMPTAATSNHRQTTRAEGGRLADPKPVALHHVEDTSSETTTPPSSVLAGAPRKVGSNTTSSKTGGRDVPPSHPPSRAKGLSRHHLECPKRKHQQHQRQAARPIAGPDRPTRACPAHLHLRIHRTRHAPPHRHLGDGWCHRKKIGPDWGERSRSAAVHAAGVLQTALTKHQQPRSSTSVRGRRHGFCAWTSRPTVPQPLRPTLGASMNEGRPLPPSVAAPAAAAARAGGSSGEGAQACEILKVLLLIVQTDKL